MLNYDESGRSTNVDMIYYFKINTYSTLPLQFQIKKVETIEGGTGGQETILGENILINGTSTNQIITYKETRTRL